jgi:hypothetical protein
MKRLTTGLLVANWPGHADNVRLAASTIMKGSQSICEMRLISASMKPSKTAQAGFDVSEPTYVIRASGHQFAMALSTTGN